MLCVSGEKKEGEDDDGGSVQRLGCACGLVAVWLRACVFRCDCVCVSVCGNNPYIR